MGLSKAKHVKIDKPDETEIFPIVNRLAWLGGLRSPAASRASVHSLVLNSSQEYIYEYFPSQHVYGQ